MSLPSLERVSIAGPAGTLEAVVEVPGAGTAPPQGFAVLCHPHPLHGGTMENKVVTTLARCFQDLGMPTLRFNFRGVGQSQGAFDDGVGETQDALAVLAYGRSRWPGSLPVLAGFSFGGHVALRAAASDSARDVERLVTVAPALTRYYATPAQVAVPHCPWLIVQGDADEVIDANSVIEWAGALQPAPALAVLPGVGHFFHGQLNALRGTVTTWISAGQ